MSAPIVSMHPRGSGFVKMAMAMIAGRGDLLESAAWSEVHNGATAPATTVLRAAAAFGGIYPDEWGGALYTAYQSLAVEMIGLIEQKSVVGQLSNLRRIPLGTRVGIAVSGPNASWIGQGVAIPVSAMGFTDAPLDPLKLGSLIVLSEELARSTSPAVEPLLRTTMVNAISERLDRSFLDPTNPGLPEIEPASITFGVTPTPGGADDAADLAALVAAFQGDIGAAYIVTSPAKLATMVGAAWPDLSVRGGSFGGFPVIATKAAEGNLIMVDPTGIAYGSDLLTLDKSGAASIQMDDSPVAGESQLVSLWQANLVALRGIQSANWIAKPGSVAFIAGS
ncbi:phage major capsid protein [Sphingosinicellaceae bacterium]|nr:phage major capsid protein [Sphingosinicellaceae bacterium]